VLEPWVRLRGLGQARAHVDAVRSCEYPATVIDTASRIAAFSRRESDLDPGGPAASAAGKPRSRWRGLAPHDPGVAPAQGSSTFCPWRGGPAFAASIGARASTTGERGTCPRGLPDVQRC
jgi:hypothetical protein